ncbi:MAG: hypothetical protein QNJ77_01320 [Acidimicrobiia bacterium]|nr:hypothetical protein [Acidimicrobiia bacterium]
MAPNGSSAADVLLHQLIGSELFEGGEVLNGSSMFYFPGRSGFAGHYQGHAAVVGILERLSGLTRDTLEFIPSRVVSNETESRVLLSRIRGHRRAKRLDAEAVHVVSLSRGVVQEIWLLHTDQALVDDFWTDETQHC